MSGWIPRKPPFLTLWVHESSPFLPHSFLTVLHNQLGRGQQGRAPSGTQHPSESEWLCLTHLRGPWADLTCRVSKGRPVSPSCRGAWV